MDIIPVIDVMGGLVVHARQGRRETYRPLESPLCQGAGPEAVIEGFLRLHPFRTFYLADLDALMGRAPQTGLLARLRRAFPELELWVDRGLPDESRDLDEPPIPDTVPVVGSESLEERHLERSARPGAGFVLSLDYRDNGLVGPKRLLECPDWWPDRVILMNLVRVGSLAGPDFSQAEDFVRQYPRQHWVAAGGVRDAADLVRLESLGIAAVLAASALHSGAVDATLLTELCRADSIPGGPGV